MEKSELKPEKELVNPIILMDLIDNSSYPKPRWMINDSVHDTCWLLSHVGVDISFFKKNKDKAASCSFKRKVSPNEYLTDDINRPLLIDIQNSLLYLDVTGKCTRPLRIRDIFLSTIGLIFHTNELRLVSNKPPIRSFEQIHFKDVKDYLLSFNTDPPIFECTLDSILNRWNSVSAIDWEVLKQESKLTTRKFASLKHKLTDYFKSEKSNLFQLKAFNVDSGESAYQRQYQNANRKEFDLDYDLWPKEKTISNELSKLGALYTAKPAQIYKFQHDILSLFAGGRSIFNEMLVQEKTPLMPISTSLHAISSSLHFTRTYGAALRKYLYNLSQAESARIKELGIAISTSAHHTDAIKQYAYKNTPIPEILKNLKITSWGERKNITDSSELRNGMSANMAIRLYTAAIWIQLASFTAGRKTSLQYLKRDCFRQSPIDGLFDLILRIPKGSERVELEEVYRPIPDLIFDYGLEFAALTSELEERRGFIGAEDELFLFGSILAYSSSTAFKGSSTDICKGILGKDYIDASLDMFMDWCNSPLIDGKRWYPSTHQFRRIFAVLYFNFSDQTGLDELSWFMGHSNLDQTFHYAEIAPNEEWIEEAETTIARIGASLNKTINGDSSIKEIIGKARKETSVSIILEPLVLSLIDEHKKNTGEEVRFRKIDGQDVFFYFSK